MSQNVDPETGGEQEKHVNVLQLLLRHSDNLSRTLQNSQMTICQGKDIAGLTTKALQSLWSDVTFPALWDKFLIHAKNYNINEPSLPRKRKTPARLLN